MNEKTVVTIWNYPTERYYYFVCYSDTQLERFLARVAHPSYYGVWGEPEINPLNELRLFGTGKEEARG